jgi:hypothetical protein
VPVGSVTGDAVAEPMPTFALTPVAVPVVEARLLVGTPDPVPPSDVAAPEPDVEKLSDSRKDVLLLGVDVPKPAEDEMDDVVAVCISSIEMPLLARTDPVWTLAIGLHGIVDVVIGGGLGGVSGTGFDGTCAPAVDAYAIAI